MSDSTRISMVTMNRRDILEHTLEALAQTCEGADILVTDNGSTDGTPDMLRSLEKAGKLRAFFLPDNRGSARARNLHWHHCIGHPTVKMDDKVEWMCPGWLPVLEKLSAEGHAIMGPAYADNVRPLENLAPCIPYVQWEGDAGIGGPYLYIPAEVTTALGAWDELPGVIYGWDDVLYIQRARLLGWNYRFSLRTPIKSLASASPESRAMADASHHIYEERLREYREAERDLYIAPGGNQHA